MLNLNLHNRGYVVVVTFVLPRKNTWYLEYDYSEEEAFSQWLTESKLEVCSISSSWVNGTVTKHVTFKKKVDAAMAKLYWG